MEIKNPERLGKHPKKKMIENLAFAPAKKQAEVPDIQQKIQSRS